MRDLNAFCLAMANSIGELLTCLAIALLDSAIKVNRCIPLPFISLARHLLHSQFTPHKSLSDPSTFPFLP